MQSEANLNNEEERPEIENDVKPQETNDIKTYENDQPQAGDSSEPTGAKKLLQPKYLIPIIIAAVVIIVVIVVLCVVLIDDDDITWEEAYKKAKKFLKDFTLDEKIMLLYSTENLMGKCVGSIDPNKERKFPGICLQDGPAGVRFAKNTQSWQAAINTASTFDRDLMYKVGVAQGKEFKDKGINIMLAPCMNILRNPLGGRIWEAYGEDPFLSGETAAEVIKGIQKEGVIACAKHFVANEIELPRHNLTANVPEQALWEIYVEPFYKSIKKGDVASIMESYNAVNNTFMTRNKRLLQEILKDKFDFKGFIMSDWWAINSDSYENFANGMDMNMPGGIREDGKMSGKEGSYWYKIPDWIESGYITEDRVDDAAIRIIAAMYKLEQIPGSVSDKDLYPNYVNLDKNTITDDTKKLNREVGADSIVLLQNNNNFLPLKNNKISNPSFSSISVIGGAAAESECLKGNNLACQSGETRYFTGYVGLGWGSGTTDFNYQVSPLAGIKSKTSVTVNDYTSMNTADITSIKEIPLTDNSKCSDVNLVFISADSGEEFIKAEGNEGDRTSLNAWHDGNDLVNSVVTYCTGKKNVLIILAPATVNIDSSWKTFFDAIIFGGMLGAEGGNALADVLFGDVVPSGHLTFVWGPEANYPSVALTDVSGDPLITKSIVYEEGLFVGQRYFEKNNKEYDYPFGYGLSYTTFSFSDLSLSMKKKGLTVKFKVKNTGKYKGKVVPMVFLKFPIDNYPEKVFKGFDKKSIKSGSSSTFKIVIEDHDLSYYDVSKSDYVRPTSGDFTVYVGENARDIKLTKTIGANY